MFRKNYNSFVASDASKINMKSKLENQVKCLEEYSVNDLHDYPGWTFLIDRVVKLYKVCPYLNNNDVECQKRRIEWLENQPDKGEFYKQVKEEIMDQDFIPNMEKDLENIKESLVSYVENSFKDLLLPENITLDTLIENIKIRKEAKSQNKKIKESWNLTIRVLEQIMIQKHFDFSKYIKIVFGFALKYNAPEIPLEDPMFNKLVEDYNRVSAKLLVTKTRLETEKKEAEEHLAILIQENFQVEQVGRFFKRWSSLTPDKKEDRIKSYCDWYMRKNNLPVNLGDEMKEWVLSKLITKELRVMDIEWNSKLGYITNINITHQETEDKQLVFDYGTRVARILKRRKSSKKKKEDLFQTDKEKLLLQRVNRLLLFEILKGNILNKESIIKSVISNSHSRIVSANLLQDYVYSKYDEMLKIILENPINNDAFEKA